MCIACGNRGEACCGTQCAPGYTECCTYFPDDQCTNHVCGAPPPPKPDLVVETHPTQGCGGLKEFKITNVGNATATGPFAWTAACQLHIGFDAFATTCQNLAPGQSCTHLADTSICTSAGARIEVNVDNTEIIDESNETNNRDVVCFPGTF
jgi:hypothetical protein